MISSAQIKFIRSLQQKKFRRLHAAFVAEGEKIVDELIDSDLDLECLCGLEEWFAANRHRLPKDLQTIVVSPAELDRISELSSPNKVLAVVRTPKWQWTPADLESGLALVLDGIQDPGNLGTILRTADWFGIRHVFCSPDTAEALNPKVVQASMGSFIRVRVHYTDLVSLLEQAADTVQTYGASLDGEALYKCPVEHPALLVIGNESRGISKELLPLLKRRVTIPGMVAGQDSSLRKSSATGGSGVLGKSGVLDKSPGKDGAESLNASVAAGILMAWFSRSGSGSPPAPPPLEVG
ncbi:MAG: RNA methyltransferase [Bacteroidales bacterium]